MKNSKRIWSNEELTIAFYIAKYGVEQLKMDEDFIVDYVIGNTSVASLKMQVANFNELLDLDGPRLTAYSKAMITVVDNNDNKSQKDLTQEIFDFCDTRENEIADRKIKVANRSVSQKTLDLNIELNRTFDAKMKSFAKMGRRLTPVVK
tara:strand:+ start:616 stop:1062 length:447 start_codon:yes stop_codon:yes gene_type:complete